MKVKYKLPILIGGIYLVLSLPFIFGYLQPSMHEGGYSAVYVFLNFPGLIIISGIADKIDSILNSAKSLQTSNLITLTLLCIFWTAISFIIAALVDEIKRRRKTRQA